ncbi:8-amino-7-oxononanoate synthase [Thiosocius teredinicola]|uniref:8-amino-7-oxononanoate synthase n=1 Tax=Thiosocius teredinicola TaxID=1973002 RepID=UPI0038CD7294
MDESSMQSLQAALEQRRREGLYRQRRVTDGAQGPELVVDGRRMLSFCSNDYLGLAADPRLGEAVNRGVARYGVGSGAAHLISGHSAAHHALEEELAEFTGRERALLFSTGYMANLGVLSALLGRSDTVLEDRLNHASLIDGGILSRARFKRYAHADTDALAGLLREGEARCLVATDGVFSMDGDIAPLAGLAEQCSAHNAWLMVDDAHGIGVVGPQGRGSIVAAELGESDVPILMGTLGKALGTAGAFVAGPEVLIETLIQQARPYIYTTAMPAAIAEATRASLRIVLDEEWRRERLQGLIVRFRRGAARIGLELMDSETPIQPILLGSAQRALQWSDRLYREGILVTAIRPPTVPDGAARLRVTLSASHTVSQVETLLSVLEETAAELA